MRGGARPNSGPKYQYGEPTKVMRVPVSLHEAIKAFILRQLKKRDLNTTKERN